MPQKEAIQPQALTIGRLARDTGMNLETVRYYERQGLIPEPPRTRSGYRMYPAETSRRLRFIRRAKELGFSLTEIGELLSLRVRSGNARAQVRASAERKIADIEAKLRALQAMKKSLQKLTTECSGCGSSDECPILDSLEREDA